MHAWRWEVEGRGPALPRRIPLDYLHLFLEHLTMLRAFLSRPALRATIHTGLAALLIAYSVPAQTLDQLRAFQQQQQQHSSSQGTWQTDGQGDTTADPSDPTSNTTVDCSDPDNPPPDGSCPDAEADQSDTQDETNPAIPSQAANPLRTPRLSRDTQSMPTTRKRTFKSEMQPPERPSEFQTFVKESTGQSLPIYGSWLFEHAPSTFAPVDHTPVPPDYTVGPSDEVDLRVWGQINFSQRLLVDRTGDIFIPQVGRVSLAGLKYTDLQDTLKNAIGRVYKNFDMNVNMGQLRSIQVFVVGEVRHPGTYTVSSFSTLVNALFASGGPSSRGSMRSIQLKRQGQVITSLDLYDLLLNGDKSKDMRLQPGDVIFVPRVGSRIAVSGSVETPGIYELKQGACLREVLQYAGGLSPVAAGKQAMLQRVDAHSQLAAREISLNTDGLSTEVQDGDIVRLLSVVPRFDKTITLRGNVADPMRFLWKPGMKISDIIPDKQTLLTRDFWTQHNRMTAGSAGFRDEALSLDADKSTAATTEQSSSVTRHFLKKNDVQPPAADIDWNYAVVERIDPTTLTTHLLTFNLAKAVIDHDPDSDLALEPGDVISVFSNSDFVTPRTQQTIFVRVEGEVKMAGVYSVKPGETLHALLARAGGLTSNAYIYGAEFTRESARVEQEKRLSEYVDQLEQEVDQNASALATHAISSEQDTTLQTALQTQRATIARLRNTPASGRVVLNVSHDSQEISSLPDIPLENGDQLIVPATPSTVEVVGTVYNQSTFLYTAGLRVGDYLHEAGGPTRYADRGRMFILRADGSVESKDVHSLVFQTSFNNLKLYPGDAVVVPPNVLRTTRIRTMLDWSQVIGNFGLGAAAINVLR